MAKPIIDDVAVNCLSPKRVKFGIGIGHGYKNAITNSVFLILKLMIKNHHQIQTYYLVYYVNVNYHTTVLKLI